MVTRTNQICHAATVCRLSSVVGLSCVLRPLYNEAGTHKNTLLAPGTQII
jgi:hypothetical protein